MSIRRLTLKSVSTTVLANLPRFVVDVLLTINSVAVVEGFVAIGTWVLVVVFVAVVTGKLPVVVPILTVVVPIVGVMAGTDVEVNAVAVVADGFVVIGTCVIVVGFVSVVTGRLPVVVRTVADRPEAILVSEMLLIVDIVVDIGVVKEYIVEKLLGVFAVVGGVLVFVICELVDGIAVVLAVMVGFGDKVKVLAAVGLGLVIVATGTVLVVVRTLADDPAVDGALMVVVAEVLVITVC